MTDGLLVQLHTLILLNIGGLLDLTHEEWFGSFDQNLSVHVIDSLRPLNLECLFLDGEQGEKIVVWDDGSAEKLKEEAKSWEYLAVSFIIFLHFFTRTNNYKYNPAPDSDEEISEDDYSDIDDEFELSEMDDYMQDSDSGKRRATDEHQGGRSKRRRLRRGVCGHIPILDALSDCSHSGWHVKNENYMKLE
jgi:cell division control protein 45